MADHGEPCRVLIVDDDEQTRTVIRTLLEGLGATVVGEAENGEEAIQVFEQCGPDITFLDIAMPIKDGVDTLRELIEKTPTANVVMLSATSDSDVADSCIDLGARSYIRKGAAAAILKIMLKSEIDAHTSDS